MMSSIMHCINKVQLYVGRMKTNAAYEVIERRNVAGNVLTDEVIRFTAKKVKKDWPIALRRITFRRVVDQKVLVFISNELTRSAEDIAALYKQRWQIELFFKWINPNLKMKRLVSRSENAVLIKVLTAIIAYLLLKLIQNSTSWPCALQKTARLVGINLTSSQCLLTILYPDLDRATKPQPRPDQLKFGLCYA
jgi:putative transposase